MRLLVDMGISPKSVAYLRRLDHDVVHLFDQHLEQLTDQSIIEKACLENRVLLTHDLDFGEIMAASGNRLPSVVTFRLRKMHPDVVNRYLEAILADHQETLKQGVLISVTEAHIRVRHLPIG